MLAAATAFAVAAVAAALVLAQLAGWRTTDEPATPGFLTAALGAPQADAPPVRKPGRDVEVSLRDGLAVSRDGAELRLAAEGVTGPWTRYGDGIKRPAPFGEEVVLAKGPFAEQLLVVHDRQGAKTWRWRLHTTLDLESRDGQVLFRRDGADVGFRIFPVRIFDATGADVTPAGARWQLDESGRVPVLELELDDAGLPVPYVIDPPIAFVRELGTAQNKTSATSVTFNTTGAIVAGDSVFVATATDNIAGSACFSATVGGTAVTQDSFTTNDPGAGNGARATLFSGHNFPAKASGSAVTVNFFQSNCTTAASITAKAVTAFTYSGLRKAGALDQTNSGGTDIGTGTAVTSSTLTTTWPDELIVGVVAVEGPSADTFTAGGSFTARTRTGTTGNPVKSNMSVRPQARIVTATGGYTAPATITSRDWANTVATYKNALAANGSGSLSVSPTSVTAGTTGNTLTFTYTAAAGGMENGALALTLPAGWTAPTTTAGTAGYTTAAGGSGANTIAWNGGTRVLTISGVTLTSGQTLTITYGSGAGGGATAPSAAQSGTSTFSTTQFSGDSGSGSATALAASPSVTVDNAADGSGTMTVSPTTVTVAAPATLTFTYTAVAGGTNGGSVTVLFPASWPAPNTIAGTPGYTTASGGSGTNTLTWNGGTRELTVSGVTLDAGSTLTVAYGTGAGGAVTVPAGTGAQTWTTQQRSQATGTLTSLGTSPQTTKNNEPTATVSLSPGSPTTNQTLTATATRNDLDGDTVTLTYVWKVDGVTRQTTSGSASLTDTFDLSVVGNGDKGQTVSVEVTPNDSTSDGATVGDSEVVANSAPTMSSAAIDQGSPATNDTLTVSVASADADGDGRTYAYQWRRNGADIAGATAATLDLSQAGHGDKGDAITVRVTASDGTDTSAPTTSAAATVANSAPTVTSVTIDQGAPQTNDALTVTVVSADADGDARTHAYQWAKNGVDRLGETGAGYDLSLIGNGDRGDAITIRVTASDGTASSTPSTSAGVTVANTAPVLASVSIDQAAPTTNDTLTATVSATDADGDTLTPTRQWRKNGADLAGETAATLDLSQAGNGDRADTIALRVSVSDGALGDGPLTSGGVTVANAAPTITSASIDQASPATGDTLTVAVASADLDGDARTYAYQWRRNGVDIGGATGATLDLSQAGHGDRGDAVSVRITASDGTASSAPTTTGAVTVANSAPTATVALAPASPTTGQTLTATAASNDADGDTVTLTYVWKVNGVTRQTTAGSPSLTDTFDLATAGNGDKGQTVTVEITPNDGTTDGTAATDSETVANSAPTATVALAPASPTTGQTLTATATSNDADGDTATLTYVWKVNGVTRQTTAGSPSLTDTFDLATAGNGDKDQTVTVEITPNDGTTDGTTATDSETVANSAPTITSVTIDQASPGTDDTLSVTVASADADGDARGYAYQWQRNGSDLAGATGATLDLSQAGNGSRGDTIAVRVVANDGSADSAPSTSAAVSVQNTAPTATVVLTPAVVGTNDTLTATATRADADGDTVTLTYVWKVNGVTRQTTAGSSSLTDAFDLAQAGNGSVGDTIAVEVTPSDGDADGTAAADSTGIGNSLPTATVSLAPASPTTNGTLTATATKADTDGDAVTLTYVWKVNGVTRQTTAGSPSLTDTFDLAQAGNGSRGETVAVEVTPNDGSGDGASAADAETVANSAPTAGVTLSPAAPRTDELVTATAARADADGDPVTLTYVWKVDGVTRKTTSGTSSLTDTFDLAQAGNGDKSQSVTVEVTPNDGDADGAAASDGVTVANSAPVLSTVTVDQAAPKTNDTLTFSFAATDADGDPLTPTRQWRRNGADLAGETGAGLDLAQAGNGDRGDTLAIQLSVSDGSASSGTLTSGAVTVANSAPTVVSVTIDQPSPRTNDALTVTVVSADPDGDARTHAYQWAANGVDRFGETASGYDLAPIGNGDRGDGVTVRVTAGDGLDTSAAVTSPAVTVANSAPVMDSVSVAQASPTTDDTLTLTLAAHDDDGDGVTYAHQWRRNGSDLAGATAAALDLSTPGYGDEGDQLAARVTATDGSDTSTPLTSAAVTVANSAPTAAVALAPASPTTDQILTATAAPTDPDAADTVTLTYVWKVDGTTVRTTAATGSLSDTLDLSQPGNGDRGDAVTVEVTPNDGSTDGPAATDTETVANSAPTISSVAVDQGSPATNDTLTVTVVSADADGDVRTYAYQWRRNGADLAGATGATLDLSQLGHGDRGDDLSVRVVASDGTAPSAPSTAVAVTVQNTAPAVTSVAIDQAGPGTNDTLTATVASADADGDSPSYAYQWRRNGTDIAGATAATLDLSQAGHGDKGDAIAVEVTAHDGTAGSAPSASAAVTIENTAPTITSVTIDQAAPRTNDALTVTVVSADADGDARSYGYQWARNGVDRVGETAAGYDLSVAGNGDKADAVTVRVVASDGSASSAPATSGARTVANSAPVLTTVAIDQATARTDDTLTSTVTAGDADGDTVTVTRRWTTNGADLVGETAASLDLSGAGNGDRGDLVRVRGEATDGTDPATPVTSTALTIANSTPSATVSLAPGNPGTDDVLTATATRADPDGDPLTLTYVWKVDGTAVKTTAGSAALTDTLDLAQAGNGDHGDTVTVEVTPNDGSADGTAAIDSAVVANVAPTATVALAPASPRTAELLTATATKDDGDGDPVTLTYVWKVDGTTVRTTTGAGSLTDTLDLAQAGNGDTGQTVTVEVTPNDGAVDGTTVTDGETVVNSAPTIASVSIDQASPQTGDTLTVSVVSADADGDARTYAYQWRRNGADLAGATTATLDLSQAGHGDKGDDVTVEVVASDGAASSAPASSAAVTVANSAPTIASVAIDQASPKTADTLTATIVSTDADGDARTYAYQWRRNGADIAGATTATLDLSQAGHGDKGDDVSVRVTASDGAAGSAPSTSAAVTVANSAPTVVSVAIDQAAPRTDDALSVTVVSSDADGDPRALSYQWAKNGVDRFGETGPGYDLSLLGNGDKGDALTVRVVADDGGASSLPVTSGARTVANSAPVLTTVAIDQAAPRTNDALTATIVASDADGDALTATRQWRRNGVDLAGETGAGLDLSAAGNGDKGDAIELRASVGDGTDTDGPSTSAPVTILNTAPTVSSVAIDQTSPRTNDTLTVTVTSADDDGDARTYAYEWRLNGSTLAGETGAALDLSQPGNGAKGDTVSVRVTASDGSASSTPSTSPGESVENTAPSCAATSLSTTQDSPADTAPVCTDADAADSLTPSVAAQGTRGVASILAGLLRYVPNAGEKGADTFTYRASDGTDQSAAADVAVTIQDVTPPQTAIDSGPADGSTSTSTSAAIAFSSDDAPATFECRLDGGAWASCTSPRALAGLGEGLHTFEVRATDDGANTDPTPASRTWTVDSVAPETTLGTTPADPTNDTTPDFTFGSEPGATFEARLDGGAWAPATSPLSLGPVAGGGHTFEVRATDAAGNTDATAASYTWTVDLSAPSTSIDAQPGDPDADRTPTFGFSSSEAPSTFECRVDAGAWAACTSPHTTAELGDGGHTFSVRATDAAGNTDAAPASYTWDVDSGAPTVAIAAPAGFVNGAAADPFTLTATSPDADVTQVEFFECSAAGCSGGTETSLGVDADGAPWQLPRAVPADGRWTIKAVATDGALNIGSAVVDATVDRTAPTGGSITVPPGYDTDGSVAIASASGGDGGGSGVDAASATIEREDAPLAAGSCGSFDGSWTTVSAPDAAVSSGECYRYRLRVRDHAGNWATFTSTDEVKVDLTAPPAPTLTLGNVSGTRVAGTTVFFRPGTGGSFTVSPASADPESGGVTFTHPDLGVGWSRVGTTWSFSAAAGDPSEPNTVTATNAAGLTSAAATFTVTGDSAAPVTTASPAPAANTNGWNTAVPVSVTLAASDGGAGVKEIRYTTDGSVPGPTSPLYAAPVDLVSPGTTTLTFRAEDEVGNLEAPATLTVRIDTTAPTTPSLSFSDLVNAAHDGTVVWFRPGAAGGFTVAPSASDPESGIGSTTFPTLGAGWSNTGGDYSFTAAAADPAEPNEVVATNGAGLASAGAPVTVTADSNAPVSAAACDAGTCSAGWYTTKPVTVVLTANDAQSGLDEIAWSTDGSAPTAEYLAPLSLSAEGTTTVRFASRDNVGNVETTVAQEVRIDTVAPTAAMGAVDPYLRGTVALTSTQSDATSGVGGVQFQVSPAGAGSWANVPSTWDTTGSANGEYDVRVRVTDAAGNVTDSAPVASRWVDNLAPTVTLDAPASPASGSVTLTSTANDAHSGVDTVEYAYSVAGANDWRTTALSGALWDTTQLADGSYDVRARASDRSGNVSAWSVVNGVLVDNDPPAVAVSAPADGAFVNAAAADPFTLAATASDTGSGVASVEFHACTTTGPSCSSWTSVALDTTPAYTGAWTLPADGERRVKVVATDGAGHSAEAAVTVTVDRTAPAASLTAPSAGANVRGTIPLTAAAADATSGVNSVDFQRSPAGASTWTTIGSDGDGADGWTAGLDTTLGGAAGASDGLYDLRVFVTDRAGNTQAHVAANVRIDNTAPTGTLTDPGQYLRGSLALSGSAADGGSGVASVAFQRSPEGGDTWTTIGTDADGGDGWSTTFDTTGGGTPDGRYDLRLLVTDRAGNEHVHALAGRTIDNTTPTAAIADPGANLRLTVALGGAADDATAGVANVAFEYDNGGGWQLISTDTDGANGWSASLNTTLPATPDGLYAFRITVTDRAGNEETSQIAGRRIDNTAPAASFADPGPYLMGAVQLSASAGDAGSGIDVVRFERSPAGSGGPWTQVGSDATLAAGTWRTTWNASPDGLYDLRVVVDDVAGNRTIDGVASRRVDNTAPVTTDDAAPGRHNTDQTVTLSRSDAGSGPSATQYRVRRPGGSFGAWQSGTTVPILASAGDGVHTIEYFSTDAAGNVESVKSTEVLIDTTGPSGTVTDPSTFLRGLVPLTATADDPADVSSVEFAYAPEGTSAWTQIGTDLTADGSDAYTVDWDTTTVADLAYDLQVTFLDSLGNPTVQSLTGKTVDNELPAIALTAPAPGAVKRNVFAITANAADGVSGMREVRFEVKPAGAAGFSQVDVDDGTAPYSTSWDSNGSPDGPTDLRVIAVDVAGNLRSATTTIFVDNDAPTVTVSAPSTAVSGSVALSATGSSDVQSVTFKVDGAAIGSDGDGSDGFSATWSTAGDGDQVVTAEATDVGGNVGTSSPVTVRVDNTDPTGSVTTPNDGDTVGGPSIALAASAFDAGSGVSATTFEFKRTSDSTWTPVAGSSWDATALATGAYDVRARLTDNAGNTAATAAITVTVDSSAPTVVLTTPGSNGIAFSGVRTLAANVSGADVQRVVFAVAPSGTTTWTSLGTDSAGADGWTHVLDTATVGDGVYDVRAQVFDSYGNSNASVRTSIRIDNTTPQLVGSSPADGATLTAAPGSIDATASEPLSAVTGVTLNGSPVAATVAGSTFSVVPGALATGAYTLAGTLVDASARTAAFRLHFTVVTGSPAALPYVERNAPAGTTTSLTAVDGASRVIVPAGAASGGADWLVVRIQPLAPSSVTASPAGAPSSVVDVTARWALAGTQVHSFLVPLELVLTGSSATTVPAIFEGGAWRLIRPIPGGGTLPEGSPDGFFRADDGVHVLTRHLSVFALIRDLEAPSPPRAIGVVAGDGLTLRWIPGADNSGTVGQVKLYVNGSSFAHYDPTQTEAKLGPWTADDTRRFTFTQLDLAGNESAQTKALRGVPALVGRTLAQAQAALADRGFSVGTVTEKPSSAAPGTVIEPAGLALAEEGAVLDLVVAAGGVARPPQAKLVLGVVSPKTFSWGTRAYVGLRVKVSRPSNVTATLIGPRGLRLYTWRVKAKAGASIVRLRMPRQVRGPGVYRIVVTATSGSQTTRRTIRIRIVRKGGTLGVVRPRGPVEVALAGDARIRKDLALGLTGANVRLIAAAGDAAFEVTGNARRDIRVVVVDVDRYGLRLVRDLKTVFPTVRLLALASRPTHLRRAKTAGADVAMSRTAAPARIVRAIRALASR